MLIRHHRIRGGATAAEAAVVLPVVFLLVVGIIVGGMSVFHYQQAAFLAREAARYASAHGADYQKETGQAAPTAQQVVAQAVLPRTVGMDPNGLTVQIECLDLGAGTSADWNTAGKDVHSLTATGEYVTNAVRVTVRYSVGPDVFGDPVVVEATSVMPMSY